MVGLGGAVGSCLRYGLGLALTRWLGGAWPWGTLAANVVGSLFLGLVMELAPERPLAGAKLKHVLGVGVMGGFTTYSSFNLETIRLAEAGSWGRAVLYPTATVALCLLAGWAGLLLARGLRSTG